jgi:hypothetical protein
METTNVSSFDVSSQNVIQFALPFSLRAFHASRDLIVRRSFLSLRANVGGADVDGRLSVIPVLPGALVRLGRTSKQEQDPELVTEDDDLDILVVYSLHCGGEQYGTERDRSDR